MLYNASLPGFLETMKCGSAPDLYSVYSAGGADDFDLGQRVPDKEVKEINIAGRQMVIFNLPIQWRGSDLPEFDRYWFRAADVVLDVPSNVTTLFFAHLWQLSLPEFVWVHNAAITPVPFTEAVFLWALRAAAKDGNHWFTLVNRELNRLGDIVLSAFEGLDPPCDDWSRPYQASSALEESPLIPKMYSPSAIEEVYTTVSARLAG